MGIDFLADHAGALADKPAVTCGDRSIAYPASLKRTLVDEISG